MSRPYVFCLEPEKRLYNIIQKIKNNAKTAVGNKLYLNDPPHMTLYLGYFDITPNKLREKLIDNLESNEIPIELEKEEIFGPDPITKKKTLLVKIRDDSRLNNLQKRIIKITKPHLSNQRLNRYKNQKLAPNLEKNVQEYGYPFVGEIWKPHISIASFDIESFNQFYNKSKIDFPEGKYILNNFVIYELDEDIEEIKELFRIELK
jgi:hypothetical protein